jgi:hypothetical protein
MSIGSLGALRASSSGPPTPSLHNKDLKAIICVVFGALIALGGFFLLLAALNVLPSGINAISQLGTSGLATAGAVMILGLLLAGSGLFYCNRENTIPLPSQSTNNAIRDSYHAEEILTQTEQRVDEVLQQNNTELLNPSTTLNVIDVIQNEGTTQTFQPLEITTFDQGNLLPSPYLPLEMVELICSFIDSKTASTLAILSKDWYSYMHHHYEGPVNQLISKPYESRFFPYWGTAKKRYSSLNGLRLTQEHERYKRHALNDLYSLYHVEISAMISSWGTLRAIMTDKSVFNWCFVVDFHRSISLTQPYGTGIMVNMTGGHGIFESPFSLRGMYEQGSTRVQILSKNRIAFSIDVVENYFLWMYAGVIDDSRVKDLDRQIKENERENKHFEAASLREKYRLFTDEDCLRFTLQMIKNGGQKILNQGLYLSGNDPYREFSLQEIVENYTSNGWQVTYLHELT